jgi:single-strand DNA-binding protein
MAHAILKNDIYSYHKKGKLMLNQVTLIGNVTRDPQIRYLQSGVAVCDIGLALNKRVKIGENWEERASFVDVTCWKQNAEYAGEYIGKGDRILVVGELTQDTWESDGKKNSKIKVTADTVKNLSAKKNGGEVSGNEKSPKKSTKKPAKQTVPPGDGGNGEDIPF